MNFWIGFFGPWIVCDLLFFYLPPPSPIFKGPWLSVLINAKANRMFCTLEERWPVGGPHLHHQLYHWPWPGVPLLYLHWQPPVFCLVAKEGITGLATWGRRWVLGLLASFNPNPISQLSKYPVLQISTPLWSSVVWLAFFLLTPPTSPAYS